METQRPHALWERSVSLFASLHVSVSQCLCLSLLSVSPGLPLAHHYDSLLGAKREHIGLDFESESEKLGQDDGGERACRSTLN